jgi:hypothetical protein
MVEGHHKAGHLLRASFPLSPTFWFDEGIDTHDERGSAAVQVSDFDRLSNLAFRGASGASIVGKLCGAVWMRVSVTMPIRSLYLAGIAPFSRCAPASPCTTLRIADREARWA